MKKYILTLSLLFSSYSFAFMSGLDDRRDTHGSLEIIGAYIPMGPAGMVNAGYMKLENTSNTDITINHITSPVYDSVEIHGTIQENGIAKMTHLDNIVVPANGKVIFEPGGMHLMLMGSRRDIKAGDEILAIAFGQNEKRYMLKFLVVDPRNDSAKDIKHHNHDHHNL